MHTSCVMNHGACIMNLPVWTLSMFFVRLSHGQRAAGQGQQKTNSCQANFPMDESPGVALGLWDEIGHEASVICTIKSSCFSSELRFRFSLRHRDCGTVQLLITLDFSIKCVNIILILKQKWCMMGCPYTICYSCNDIWASSLEKCQIWNLKDTLSSQHQGS